MVRKPVTTQAMINNPGEFTSRAISADTMNIPEPIIDPMTRVVALVRPRPLTSSALLPAEEPPDGVLELSSADVGIFVLYVLPQNAQKILNCFCRGVQKVSNHGHRIGPGFPDLMGIDTRNPANCD
jgi:hypothetical protein